MAFILEGLAEAGEAVLGLGEESEAGLASVTKKLKVSKPKPTWTPKDIDYSNASPEVKENIKKSKNKSQPKQENPGGWSDEMIGHINAQKEAKQKQYNDKKKKNLSDHVDSDDMDAIKQALKKVSFIGDQFSQFQQINSANNSSKDSKEMIDAIKSTTEAVKVSGFLINDSLKDIESILRNIITEIKKDEDVEQKLDEDNKRKESTENKKDEDVRQKLNEDNKRKDSDAVKEKKSEKIRNENVPVNKKSKSKKGKGKGKSKAGELASNLGILASGIVIADIIRRAFPETIEYIKNLPVQMLDALGDKISNAFINMMNNINKKIEDEYDAIKTDIHDTIFGKTPTIKGNEDADKNVTDDSLHHGYIKVSKGEEIPKTIFNGSKFVPNKDYDPSNPIATEDMYFDKDGKRSNANKAIKGGTDSVSSGDFIKKQEGYGKNGLPYDDNGRPAIGFGHDITDEEQQNGIKIGNDVVSFGSAITKDQGQTLFEQDKKKHQNFVINGVGKYEGIGQENWDKLNSNQQEALTDYAFNVGHLPRAKDFREAIQRGDMGYVAQLLSNGISTAKGKDGVSRSNETLRKRRTEEGVLFNTTPDKKSREDATPVFNTDKNSEDEDPRFDLTKPYNVITNNKFKLNPSQITTKPEDGAKLMKDSAKQASSPPIIIAPQNSTVVNPGGGGGGRGPISGASASLPGSSMPYRAIQDIC